ncbi:PilN domain-containing protein [Halomonas vilamensis]|uniref:PilN domain-containing protein n=1 Tax=Vreelandella vilamensis TaxID=531309 RepID=A0ABU1H4G8_9GAMM|nr:PilN domain-containing protein [Halomonas vilamensis]MDR5899198.1 PilN domain-containing protein [Halomonas vilamensis]
MSAMINLLPWREEKRQRQTRRFHLLLVAMLVLGTALGFLVARFYQAELEAQRERNRYITEQTRQLEADIREVRNYEEDATELSDQLALFQTLQQERVKTVRVFNEIAQSVANGVIYQSLSRSGDTLSATAEAGSERQVSEQLRHIEQMPGLGVPTFTEVESDSDSARRVFRFEVKQQSVAPQPDETANSTVNGNQEARNET